MSSVYGCYDHPPHLEHYFSTGSNKPITNVFTRDLSLKHISQPTRP
jgi:hypothetical protein